MLRLVFLALVCVFSLGLPLQAQNASDYYTKSAAPDWVLPHAVDYSPFDLARDEPIEFLLADIQARVSADTVVRYKKMSQRLKTADEVERYVALTVDFDPAYQTVIFHDIRILRGASTRDLLGSASFDMYRVETDRERLIYNGRMQLSYFLPDLRVGDILEYAYSVEGKNPAIGPHFTDFVMQQYSVPVRVKRERLLFPAGFPVHVTSHSGAPAPVQTVEDGQDIYEWYATDLPGLDVEADQPADVFTYPQSQVSSYQSWAELGQYFAPFYDVTGPKPDEVAQVAAKITATHDTEQDRLRAALDFVQREVRYLGIELGTGGYIPRSPQQVLERRYGDCKDMVMLLTSLLHELRIDAAPLLVDFDTRGGVDVLAPTHWAFDHVIVAATVDGRTYFLDPTRGEQLGDLAHLQQGDFGKGVIIAPDSPGMIDARAPQPHYFRVFKERYETDRYRDTIRFVGTFDYFMGHADQMQSWMKSDGQRGIEKAFLEYYQGIYEGLTQTEPLVVTVFDDEARFRIEVTYEIEDAWTWSEDGTRKREFLADANGFFEDIPDFDAAPRETAHAITHPVRKRHDVELVLDESWDHEDSTKAYDHPAFSARNHRTFRDGTSIRTLTYISKANRVAPEDMKASRKSLNTLGDETGLFVTEDISGGEGLESQMQRLLLGKF